MVTPRPRHPLCPAGLRRAVQRLSPGTPDRVADALAGAEMVCVIAASFLGPREIRVTVAGGRALVQVGPGIDLAIARSVLDGAGLSVQGDCP